MTEELVRMPQGGFWKLKKTTQGPTAEPINTSLESSKKEIEALIPGDINANLWEIPIWDRDIFPGDFYSDIKNLMKRVVCFKDNVYYIIYTLWIISTWKVECWDSVCFPSFLSPWRNTGKSTALDFGVSLSYRGISCSSISFAAMPRLTHYYEATLFIDELQSKIYDKQTGQNYRDFLKTSYVRGKHYVVADLNSQAKVMYYRNFGPKAYASERKIEEGVLERCIPIEMLRGKPEIRKLRKVLPQLKNIRSRLLKWRMMTGDIPELLDDFPLEGRVLQLFEAIFQTALELKIPKEDYDLLFEFAKTYERNKEDDLEQSNEYDVINALEALVTVHEHAPEGAKDRIALSDLSSSLDWEDQEKNVIVLGQILSRLGVKRRKGAGGRMFIVWDERTVKRVKELALVVSGESEARPGVEGNRVITPIV